ncbi:MAG: hypothetical protein Q9220_003181 [cf. Caloplaca sp. 1 TL-2023]
MLICYFLIYYFFRQARAQSDTTLPGATYSLKSLPNPLIIKADNTQYYCIKNSNWGTATFNGKDCIGAIQQLNDREIIPKRNWVYEFLAAGAPQAHPSYYGQATPRKYVYGTCTLSVVMMMDKRLGTFVPGKSTTPGIYAATDLTSYGDIWYAASQINRLCMSSYGVPGWIPIGDASSTGVGSSVGIFLHATGSILDKAINGTEIDASISDSLPLSWNYLGCNLDVPSPRALSNLSWAGDGLTVERCAEYCAGLIYFGVEFGRECYCGDSINTYSANGGEEACDTPCNGNASQICGGVGALSVYQHVGGGTVQVDSASR